MKVPALAIVLLVVGVAHGERAVELRGEGVCPSREAIREALHDIDAELVEKPGAMPITIEGARVTAGTVSRELTEASCEARAKSAAVFVVLVLDTPAPEPAPAPPPPPAPIVQKKRRWQVTIDAAGVFTAAQPERAFTGGGSLRVFAGHPNIGAVVGIEGLAPVTLKGTVEDVRLARIPIDVGLRGRYLRRRVELSLDVELVAGPLFTRGLAAGGTSDVQRELGVRLAARVAYHASKHFAPFAAFQADVDATRYALSSAGQVLVHTPRAWLGFALGGAVDLP